MTGAKSNLQFLQFRQKFESFRMNEFQRISKDIQIDDVSAVFPQKTFIEFSDAVLGY